MKVAVKQLTHKINCFYKYCRNKVVYSTKLLKTLLVAGKLFNPSLTVLLYKMDATLSVMFQDASCDNFTEICKLFTV